MLLLFPVSVHALPGIIICIESDGSIEIESSRSGDCAEKTYTAAKEVHDEYASLDTNIATSLECGSSCLDLLLFVSPADGQAAPSVKTAQQNDGSLYPIAILFPVLDLDASKRSLHNLNPANSLAPPPLARTIVLLI